MRAARESAEIHYKREVRTVAVVMIDDPARDENGEPGDELLIC